jgi:2-oxoglutarate ferredoxin oxidoreductase subunit gamma
MAEERIIIAGFGGQGVLMLGKLLAAAGMIEGKRVTWLPAYGPEMRGGTANCHVIISDEEIGAPIVSEATGLIAMNLPSLDRFEPSVLPGGWLLLNSSLIPRAPIRGDLRSLPIPVNEIAQRQGSQRVANVVMLGACLAICHPVEKASVVAAIEEVLGQSKKHLLSINLNALEAGLAFAQPVPA